MLILALIVFALIFLKSLYFIYLFQIKEYRWDRLYSTIKETGSFPFFYNTQLRLPANTNRNALIAIIMVLCNVVLINYVNFTNFILFILLLPLLAFAITFIGVYLTGFLAASSRKKTMEKAKKYASNSNAVIIGITGTYGKSSVKEFLYHVLSAQFRVGKTDKNMNTDVGIALSVLKNLKEDTEYFIAEYGAYKVGEIEDACEIIKPTISVLTGLGNQHIDLYGSKENLVKAETYILNILDEKDAAYINSDFSGSHISVQDVKAKKLFYSLGKADIYPTEIKHKDGKQEATIKYKNETFQFKTPLLGEHNVLNLLPAIAVAYDLGMKKNKIIEAVESIEPIEGKLSLHKGIGQSTIINDSYNSVLNGFLAMIDVINEQPYEKKIIVSKGIIELGVEKRSSYQLILDKLSKTDIILFTTDHVFEEENNEGKVRTLNDESELLELVKVNASPETVIGVEGRFTKQFIDEVISNK